MGILSNAMSKAGWYGIAGGVHIAGSSAARKLAYSAGGGAIAGAGWGATFGRDPGQGRLSGAFGGAIQGALTGGAMYGAARYGSAAVRGANRTMGAYGRLAGMTQGAPSMMMRAEAMGMGAGRGAFRQMRQDAMGSYRHIANGINSNKTLGKIRSSLKTSRGG